MRPGNHRRLSSLGKRLAPALSRILNKGPLFRVGTMLSWYLAFIQGKGAGAGWDVAAEREAALCSIHKRDGLVLFDIGANVGEWSACMLEGLGDSCTIYQFEPTKECQKILERQAGANLIVVPVAVGEEVGEAEIYSIPNVRAKSSSLYLRRDTCFEDRQYSAEGVKVTTIDKFMEENEIEFVDYMKMDIEGHELAALRGAAKALERKAIGALTFEFGAGNVNSRTFFRDFWDLLTPFGYKISRICPGGVLRPIDEYYEDLEYFRGATNYLAVQVTMHCEDRCPRWMK